MEVPVEDVEMGEGILPLKNTHYSQGYETMRKKLYTAGQVPLTKLVPALGSGMFFGPVALHLYLYELICRQDFQEEEVGDRCLGEEGSGVACAICLERLDAT